MTAEVAALPDAKATQNFAFSAVATALSKAPLVGLPLHDMKKMNCIRTNNRVTGTGQEEFGG
jgi:hypothetical protein